MVKEIRPNKLGRAQQIPNKQKIQGKQVQQHAELLAKKETLQKAQQVAQSAQQRALSQQRTKTQQPTLSEPLGSGPPSPGAAQAHEKAMEAAFAFLLKNAPAALQPFLKRLHASFSEFEANGLPPDAEQQLDSYGNALNSIASNLSPALKKQYSQIEEPYFSEGAQAIQEALSAAQAQQNQTLHHKVELSKAQALILQFQALLQGISDTPTDLNQLTSLLKRMLTLLYDPQTPSDVSTDLVAALNSLDAIRGTSTHGNVIDTPALIIARVLFWQFLKQHPNQTPSQMRSLLTTEINKLDPNKKSIFIGVLKGAMKSWLDNPQTPGLQPNVYTIVHGKVVPNSNYLIEADSSFEKKDITSASLKQVQTSITDLANQVTDSVNALNKQLDEEFAHIVQLSNYLKLYQKAAAGALSQNFPGSDSTPLPSQDQAALSDTVASAQSYRHLVVIQEFVGCPATISSRL